MQCDGPRLLQLVLHQDGRHPALQVRHGHRVSAGVGPVEVGVHPVHGQPVGREHRALVNGFSLPTLVFKQYVCISFYIFYAWLEKLSIGAVFTN